MEYMAALRKIQIEMGDDTTNEQTVIHKMTDADRHRFMSDPEIKYAVVDDVIHDKQCEKLRGVSNDFIKFISSYHDHYKPCSVCAVRACIRAGAEDFENFEKYVEFYNSHGIFGKAIPICAPGLIQSLKEKVMKRNQAESEKQIQHLAVNMQ